jgi:hypothetical protein
MFIQNISYASVQNGHHILPGDNAMMINIVDPAMEFPIPKYNFKEIHRFEFLDVESENEEGGEFRITQEQANQLVDLLQHALDNRMTVIVSCVAGLCRSGAVCEVGVMMGFDDAESVRSPNLLVKTSMMRKLGWTYD